jgi:hypothetical protein
MALHYEAACDWQRAASALRAAARHAQQRQASAEAAELLEHALRMMENLNEMERDTEVGEIRRELMMAREAPTERAVPHRKASEKIDSFWMGI